MKKSLESLGDVLFGLTLAAGAVGVYLVFSTQLGWKTDYPDRPAVDALLGTAFPVCVLYLLNEMEAMVATAAPLGMFGWILIVEGYPSVVPDSPIFYGLVCVAVGLVALGFYRFSRSLPDNKPTTRQNLT